MEQTEVSPLLALPRELRDLILEYALTENECQLSENHSTPTDSRIKRQRTGNERWEWSIHYPSTAPHSTYLSLLSCNKQLKQEIEVLNSNRPIGSLTAKLLLVMAYPNLTAIWHDIPGPPSQISNLDILIKADHMYHPAFMSNGPHNAILTTVFEVVKRYIHRGPHLARPSPLQRRLSLERVWITLAPPVPFEDMTYVYGFPAQQLQALFDEFRMLMARLCRAGLFDPAVEVFEVRVVGDDWDGLNVTSNFHDEPDAMFFQHGGYVWDCGESLV